MKYDDIDERRRKLDEDWDTFFKFFSVVGIIFGVLVFTGLGISIYNAFTYTG